eukprot:Lithocolla_globosa_v1_NODE_1960_length_2238_cov_30.678424.p1 type:complete len:519 gc:universal NODE_1960_length_2238_cov_30.678424:573-2129(+)
MLTAKLKLRQHLQEKQQKEENKQKGQAFLKRLLELTSWFPNLSAHLIDLEQTLFITRSEQRFSINTGGFDEIRLNVGSDGKFEVYVMLSLYSKGFLSNEEEFLQLLHLFDKTNVACVGINNYFSRYLPILGADPSPLRRVNTQLGVRACHESCKLWFAPKQHSEDYSGECEACCTMHYDLEYKRKAFDKLSEQEKMEYYLKRVHPSSNFPISNLSNEELKKRHSLVMKERKSDKQKLKRFGILDVTLNNGQHEEMCEVVDKIRKDPELLTRLDQICKEPDESGQFSGKGDILRSLFFEDCEKNLDSVGRDFYCDQEKNKNGAVGNVWSVATYRIALSIAARSTSAYSALNSFKVLNLPSLSSLKNIWASHHREAGVNPELFAKKREVYHSHIRLTTQARQNATSEEEKEKIKIPAGMGTWIIDEVKCVAGVGWCARNQEIKGCIMSSQDMKGLHDLYETLDQSHEIKAQYVLQTLWRDNTSQFDFLVHISLLRSHSTTNLPWRAFMTQCRWEKYMDLV